MMKALRHSARHDRRRIPNGGDRHHDGGGPAADGEGARRSPEDVIGMYVDAVELGRRHSYSAAADKLDDVIEAAVAILRANGSASVLRLGAARRVLASIRLEQGDARQALALAGENASGLLDQFAAELDLATYTTELRPQEARRQIGQYIEILWRHDGEPERTHEEILRALQILHMETNARGDHEPESGSDPSDHRRAQKDRRLRATIGGLERLLRSDPAGSNAKLVRSRILESRRRICIRASATVS